jgi:iron complex transport system ATP-binding protein
MLQANHLSIGYSKKNSATPVAEGLSFSLQKGKLTCLLGPNGVGKSTLIKTILGQLPLLSGNLTLENKAIASFSQKDLAKKIAVVLTDKVNSGNLTAYQLVALGRIPHTGWLGNLSSQDKEIVERAIQVTKIHYIRDKSLSEISDGQLQKVMIARALSQDGEILILDEPTAHLDLVNRYEIMHLLREIAHQENKAVLVVTHDLDIAIDTADVFWLMQCGFPLVDGSPEDLILEGKINLMLPDEKLVFDPENGKVQESRNWNSPLITGDPVAVKWVQNALKKSEVDFSNSQIQLSIQQNPFQIEYTNGPEKLSFFSIEQLVSYLANRTGSKR